MEEKKRKRESSNESQSESQNPSETEAVTEKDENKTAQMLNDLLILLAKKQEKRKQRKKSKKTDPLVYFWVHACDASGEWTHREEPRKLMTLAFSENTFPQDNVWCSNPEEKDESKWMFWKRVNMERLHDSNEPEEKNHILHINYTPLFPLESKSTSSASTSSASTSSASTSSATASISPSMPSQPTTLNIPMTRSELVQWFKHPNKMNKIIDYPVQNNSTDLLSALHLNLYHALIFPKQQAWWTHIQGPTVLSIYAPTDDAGPVFWFLSDKHQSTSRSCVPQVQRSIPIQRLLKYTADVTEKNTSIFLEEEMHDQNVFDLFDSLTTTIQTLKNCFGPKQSKNTEDFDTDPCFLKNRRGPMVRVHRADIRNDSYLQLVDPAIMNPIFEMYKKKWEQGTDADKQFERFTKQFSRQTTLTKEQRQSADHRLWQELKETKSIAQFDRVPDLFESKERLLSFLDLFLTSNHFFGDYHTWMEPFNRSFEPIRNGILDPYDEIDWHDVLPEDRPSAFPWTDPVDQKEYEIHRIRKQLLKCTPEVRQVLIDLAKEEGEYVFNSVKKVQQTERKERHLRNADVIPFLDIQTLLNDVYTLARVLSEKSVLEKNAIEKIEEEKKEEKKDEKDTTQAQRSVYPERVILYMGATHISRYVHWLKRMGLIQPDPIYDSDVEYRSIYGQNSNVDQRCHRIDRSLLLDVNI